MRRLYILLFLFFIYFASFSQNEANNWYFGQFAGVTFSSGTAVGVSDGKLNTLEGCSAISDLNGNLLFYTDGRKVWNRNHVIMTNGTNLMGSPLSSQSGIIVPKPGNSSIYYIFTVDMQSGFYTSASDTTYDGFLYSEVDMTLNGGLGDIDTLKKNVVIKATTTENLAAIRHSNGIDYWVVVHGANDNNYYSYRITSAGVNLTPVISSTGSVVVVSSVNQGMGANGIMKISPNGTKIASTHYDNKELILSDFDASTGIVSNSLNISINTDITTRITDMSEGPYGIEFSNCNEYLYVTEQILDTLGGIARPYQSRVWRFDLNAGDVPGSKSVFKLQSGEYFGALQLGIDGKIYCAKLKGPSFAYSNSLHAINNPRLSTANFINDAVLLPSGKLSGYGLPPFIATYFYKTNISASNLATGDTALFCAGDTALFRGNTSAYDSLRWDFNDPGSGINNTSTVKSPKHLFSSSGNYQITLLKYLCGVKDTAIKNITITDYPVITDISDLNVCSGTDVLLDATATPVTSYLWNTGATTSTLSVNTQGRYIVTANNKGCRSRDSMDLTVNNTITASVSISSNTTNDICAGDNVLLLASPGVSTIGQTLQWYKNGNLLTGETTDSYFSNTLSDGDVLEVVLTLHNVGACLVGTNTANNSFAFTVKPIPTVTTPANQAVCYGENTYPVSFNSNLSFTNYIWTNNNTAIGLAASGNGNIPSFPASNGGMVTQTATVTVTPSNNGCTGSSETFTYTVNECTLPVELTGFDGKKEEEFVNKLYWSTVSEFNSDYFSLEHSQDIDYFKEIYRTKGSGNSNKTHHYDYLHYDVPSGINYYRLRMVDLDGKYTYSDIVKISNESDKYQATMYPNPASSQISIYIKNPAGSSDILIFNALGQIMHHQEMTDSKEQKLELNISQYANGVYYIKIADTKNKTTIPWIKQ